jgi:hypothetical protein
MLSPLRASTGLFLRYFLLLTVPGWSGAQTLAPLGGEYPISSLTTGEPASPHLALSKTQGLLVWHNNAIDGQGLGIAARRLDANLSPGLFAPFRVNQQVAGDQEKPSVALLKDGGAAVVWQGGRPGAQHIYVRVLKADGTFATTNDLRVNVFSGGQQSSPVIACLENGNLAVAWSSLHQDGSHYGVYARVLNTTGQPISDPVLVNQTTRFNQRNPALAALTDGSFVVAWASETVYGEGLGSVGSPPRVDIYARRFNAAGAPLSAELQMNQEPKVCAHPAVTATPRGGWMAAWSQKDADAQQSWDVWARFFDSSHAASGPQVRVNTTTYGDQFLPQLATLDASQFVVWTGLGQDGSWEGVFARLFVYGEGSGPEIAVNTTTLGRQLHPCVAADGDARFLVAWASLNTSVQMLAQRFAAGQPLPQPSAPLVAALSSSRLLVSWPELLGFPALQGYQLTMDQGTPLTLTSNFWITPALAPASTHDFRLAYLMSGGQRSMLSPVASGTTWGEDLTLDGLPDDWQQLYWGPDPQRWVSGRFDSDGDGASNYQEFLAGTNPTNALSSLRLRIVSERSGRRLVWNTQPG